MKKLFTLAAAVLASFSLWAAETVNTGTYSTQTISEDFLTSTWAFAKPSSTTNIPIGTKENDVLYQASSLGKIKVGGSNLSWSGTSSAYIYVPDGAAGTITLVPSSASDSRYLQLFVGGENAGESKRLWSKYNATPTSDGKKGPQSFTFTSADLTTVGDSTFLHFKDNNTEMKIASISIVLTSGSYANCEDPESTIKGDTTLYVNNGYNIGFNSINTNGCTVDVKKNGAAAVDDVDYSKTNINNYTFLKAGKFVITISQAADGTHCAVEESVTVTVLDASPVTAVTIDGPTAGYVGYELTYTATADNATAYQWLVDGVDANTNAATFKYTAVKGSHSIVCKARNEFNAENEWIASDPIALTVTSLYGQLIAADAETGSGNINKDITATGIVGGTVHQTTQKNAKLGGSGHYFSLTLAAGSFLAGDTVKVVVTPEYSTDKDTYSAPTQLKISTALDNSNLIGESDTKVIDPASSDDLYFDIVLTEGASTIYLARDGSICKQNPIVKSISVVRPVPVKSSSEAFKSVSVNGEALVANFDANHAMTVEGSYVDAPVVVFTKTVTTIYEDNSQVVKDVEVNVTAEEVAGAWQAQAEINSVTYTINAAKAASVTVTYKDGEEVLGTENVAINGNPAEYAQYQSKNQATFVGWYNNADLADEHAVADMSAEVITAATTYHAKFVKTYISANVNIEQLVLDNGTSYDIQSALTAAGWDYANLNSLDTLNDLENKTNRNYDYLGLKIKTAGAYIQGWIPADGGVVIKFGNLGSDIKVTVTGATTNAEQTFAKADLFDEDEQVYVLPIYGFTEDVLVKISTVGSGTVVLKQLMLINEGIQEVALPAPSAYLITVAESENGTVTASWDNKKYRTPVGATVTLTFTPAEGYIVMSCTVNGEEIHQSAPGAPITFEMPAADVTITTTFSIPTALENAEAAVKAEKVIRDGQVLILRDGKIFNALGAEVK